MWSCFSNPSKRDEDIAKAESDNKKSGDGDSESVPILEASGSRESPIPMTDPSLQTTKLKTPNLDKINEEGHDTNCVAFSLQDDVSEPRTRRRSSVSKKKKNVGNPWLEQSISDVLIAPGRLPGKPCTGLDVGQNLEPLPVADGTELELEPPSGWRIANLSDYMLASLEKLFPESVGSIPEEKKEIK